MISGDLTRPSSHGSYSPVSAYGGRAMWSGTVAHRVTSPWQTRPSDFLWQRLYFRPLPHQHGSFALGSVEGAAVTVMRQGYGETATTPNVKNSASHKTRVHVGGRSITAGSGDPPERT